MLRRAGMNRALPRFESKHRSFGLRPPRLIHIEAVPLRSWTSGLPSYIVRWLPFPDPWGRPCSAAFIIYISCYQSSQCLVKTLNPLIKSSRVNSPFPCQMDTQAPATRISASIGPRLFPLCRHRAGVASIYSRTRRLLIGEALLLIGWRLWAAEMLPQDKVKKEVPVAELERARP